MCDWYGFDEETGEVDFGAVFWVSDGTTWNASTEPLFTFPQQHEDLLVAGKQSLWRTLIADYNAWRSHA